MWEVIDTPTNTDQGFTDTLDLTLKDLADGLDYWLKMTCTPGANYSPCEMQWVDTYEQCEDTEACDAGEVCGHAAVSAYRSDSPPDGSRSGPASTKPRSRKWSS